MFRFLGCMFIGLVAYALIFLYALLIDWGKFQQFSPKSDLKQLWDIATGRW